MFVVCVKVQVIAEHVEAFIAATRENALATRQEPRNARFDVLQALDDPSHFTLYEVYKDEAGFKEHQQTPHYLAWRAAVASMMKSPRVGEKHRSLLPEPWQ
ncbi:MAG TPA: antibiotic biosynthesis monooxygenase [Pseudomonadota bacterium]|nr:antibiotic biosynthesis monooxygenase [Pseudomonadota bacterium]